MLQTRSDMEVELSTRLMAASNSASFPPARITELIDQSTKWAGSYHFWPALRRGKVTTAKKNTQNLTYDYYDYPLDFLTHSIKRLYIDGKKYDPKTWDSFLDYVDNAISGNEPSDTTKLFFSTFGRQFFVWPTYTGNPPANNLIVWGNVQHPTLTASTSQTIFSLWDDDGNDAIVCKALSIAMMRLEANFAMTQLQLAQAKLDKLWKSITDEQQTEQPLNHPQFSVPDMFAQGGSISNLGNFSIVGVGSNT